MGSVHFALLKRSIGWIVNGPYRHAGRKALQKLDIRMSEHVNVLRGCNTFEYDCDMLSVASI